MEPTILPVWPDPVPGFDPEAGPMPMLEVYPVPARETRTPVMVVCPGGGYGGHADHEGRGLVGWLHGLGVAVAVVKYRVYPYRAPWPCLDVQRALRLVRSRGTEWSVDSQQVFLMGFSAGGHAAAWASLQMPVERLLKDEVDSLPTRPDGLILGYPVITGGEHRHAGSFTNLLGEKESEETRLSLSIEHLVHEQAPPTFLWHTAEDKGVPVENSLLLASALGRMGVPYELHVFPDGRHGLGLAADCPGASAWPDLCAAWLRRQI